MFYKHLHKYEYAGMRTTNYMVGRLWWISSFILYMIDFRMNASLSAWQALTEPSRTTELIQNIHSFDMQHKNLYTDTKLSFIYGYLLVSQRIASLSLDVPLGSVFICICMGEPDVCDAM